MTTNYLKLFFNENSDRLLRWEFSLFYLTFLMSANYSKLFSRWKLNSFVNADLYLISLSDDLYWWASERMAWENFREFQGKRRMIFPERWKISNHHRNYRANIAFSKKDFRKLDFDYILVILS